MKVCDPERRQGTGSATSLPDFSAWTLGCGLHAQMLEGQLPSSGMPFGSLYCEVLREHVLNVFAKPSAGDRAV